MSNRTSNLTFNYISVGRPSSRVQLNYRLIAMRVSTLALQGLNQVSNSVGPGCLNISKRKVERAKTIYHMNCPKECHKWFQTVRTNIRQVQTMIATTEEQNRPYMFNDVVHLVGTFIVDSVPRRLCARVRVNTPDPGPLHY